MKFLKSFSFFFLFPSFSCLQHSLSCSTQHTALEVKPREPKRRMEFLSGFLSLFFLLVRTLEPCRLFRSCSDQQSFLFFFRKNNVKQRQLIPLEICINSSQHTQFTSHFYLLLRLHESFYRNWTTDRQSRRQLLTPKKSRTETFN